MDRQKSFQEEILPPHVQNLLKTNRVELIKLIDLRKGMLWDTLIQHGLVESHMTKMKEPGCLIDHISKGNLEEFMKFCEVLKTCKQGHIVTALLTGPGLQVEGKPVQIVKFDKQSGCLQLTDKQVLENILLDERVRDKPVVLVSVAGEFQTGKSMFLNQMLIYLTALEAGEKAGWIYRSYNSQGAGKWESNEAEGIYLWEKPFVVPGPDGKEVGVVLMDTQGEMDDSEDTAIFSLSSVLCSTQVYNVRDKLRDENINLLQLYVEAGKQALEKRIGDSQLKPFQRLVFLIRDWPRGPIYGPEAGHEYMTKLLQKHEKKSTWKNVKDNGTKCIEQLDCFLAPPPYFGEGAGQVSLYGIPKPVQPSFVGAMEQAAEFVLCREKLGAKRCGNKTMTGETLLPYFKACIDLFAERKEPDPEDIYQVLLNNYNEQLVAEIVQEFDQKMVKFSTDEHMMLDKKALGEAVEQAEEHARKQFGDRVKGKSKDTKRLYLTLLEGQEKATKRYNV